MVNAALDGLRGLAFAPAHPSLGQQELAPQTEFGFWGYSDPGLYVLIRTRIWGYSHAAWGSRLRHIRRSLARSSPFYCLPREVEYNCGPDQDKQVCHPFR